MGDRAMTLVEDFLGLKEDMTPAPRPQEGAKAQGSETGESSRGAHRVLSFMTCPRKFGYSYLMGIEPRIAGFASSLGTCNHEGIRAYYRGEDWARAVLSVPSNVAHRAVDAKETVSRYVREYPLTERGSKLFDIDGEVVLAEEEVEFQVCGEETMTRRLDLGLRNKRSQLLVLDHKTAARPAHRVKTTTWEPALFTQEMAGRVLADRLGLGWGGVYLNLLPNKNAGEFKRVSLSWPKAFLAKAEESLLYWLRVEAATTRGYETGEVDVWKLPMSFQCHPDGYRCDFAHLCVEGDIGLTRYQPRER
jgi:hypothetical protein